MSKEKSIVDKAKEEVNAKNQKVYTGKQIAWEAFRIAAYVTIGILIGVYGTTAINSAIKSEVAVQSQVQSLESR